MFQQVLQSGSNSEWKKLPTVKGKVAINIPIEANEISIHMLNPALNQVFKWHLTKDEIQGPKRDYMHGYSINVGNWYSTQANIRVGGNVAETAACTYMNGAGYIVGENDVEVTIYWR